MPRHRAATAESCAALRILDCLMHTVTEHGAPSRTVAGATWLAAALAAGASLLHWITTSTATHDWSGDAVVSLVAGAALMALALLLAARPWSAETSRTICLIGAVGTAVALVFFLLPELSEATSGHARQAVHDGHGMAGGDAAVSADVARMTLEAVLIGVLVWLLRLTGRPRATFSAEPG